MVKKDGIDLDQAVGKSVMYRVWWRSAGKGFGDWFFDREEALAYHAANAVFQPKFNRARRMPDRSWKWDGEEDRTQAESVS